MSSVSPQRQNLNNYNSNRFSTQTSSESISSSDMGFSKIPHVTSSEIIPRPKPLSRRYSTDSSEYSDSGKQTQLDQSWLRRITAGLSRRNSTKRAKRAPRNFCDGVVGLTEECSPAFAGELLRICNELTFSSAGEDDRNWACDTGTFDVPSIKRKAQLQIGLSLIDTKSFIGDRSLLDEFCRQVEVPSARIEKACPHLLAGLMLPEGHFPTVARQVASSFWLWLCLVDDQIESVGDVKFDQIIDEVDALMNVDTDLSTIDESEVSFRATKAFLLVLQAANIDIYDSSSEGRQKQREWKENLLIEVKAILEAFRHERPLMRLQKNMTSKSLTDWMKVRLVTISARPFMALAKASLGLSTAVDSLSNIPQTYSQKVIDSAKSPNFELLKLEMLTQCVSGMQNDIIGWEKDHRERNYLNAIEVLILRGTAKRTAFSSTVRIHNLMMQELLRQVAAYSQNMAWNAREAGNTPQLEAELKYLDALVGFTHGMAVWHTRAKRYV